MITLATGGAALVSVLLAVGTVTPVLVAVLALVPLTLAEALALLPPAAQHAAVLRGAQARTVELLTAPSPASEHQTGPVELVDVDVRWPGAAEPTLRGVNLSVRPGEHVAVVGPSGAGKSTVVALLLGFLAAERGSVRVPATIAWCPQDPQLVTTSVRENLLLADPHATDDRLRLALAQAGLPDWGDRLDALATECSGGEAQRLALARALVADADLLLLDEPTAHVDRPTAAAILAGLAGRTVVHVTHDREQAANADTVVEVRDGRVHVRQAA